LRKSGTRRVHEILKSLEGTESSGTRKIWDIQRPPKFRHGTLFPNPNRLTNRTWGPPIPTRKLQPVNGMGG